MRIILIGQAAFAEKALDTLRSKGEDVLAVFCPPDRAPDRFDPVKKRALELEVPVYQQRSMKGPEVLERFQALDADLAVLAFVTQIVPPPVFNAPKLGSICFHPSLLPRYRGGSAINWTLINGETKTGISWFWVDDGIDTGPLLVQKEAAIGPDDTTGTLYFDTLFPLGIEALGEAIDLIEAGDPPRIVQDESQANYDPLCRDEHAGIDWSRPARQVFDLIRGCDPQPGAFCHWQGRKLRLYDCRLRPAEGEAAAGQVISVGAGTVGIALNGGTLSVGKMRGEEGKAAAAEVAGTVGLSTGARLS